MAIIDFEDRIQAEGVINDLYGKFIVNNTRLSLSWAKLENEKVIEGTSPEEIMIKYLDKRNHYVLSQS